MDTREKVATPGRGPQRHLGNLEDFTFVREALLGKCKAQDIQSFVEALPTLLARDADGIEFRFGNTAPQADGGVTAVRENIEIRDLVG